MILNYGSRRKAGVESSKQSILPGDIESDSKPKFDLYQELFLLLDDLLSEVPVSNKINQIFPLLSKLSNTTFVFYHERVISSDGKFSFNLAGVSLNDRYELKKEEFKEASGLIDGVIQEIIAKNEISKFCIYNQAELNDSIIHKRKIPIESILSLPIWLNNEIYSVISLCFDKPKEPIIDELGVLVQNIHRILQNIFSVKYRLNRQNLSNRLFLESERSVDKMQLLKSLSGILLEIDGIDISELYVCDEGYHLVDSNLGKVKDLFDWHFEKNKELIDRMKKGRRVFFNIKDLRLEPVNSEKREFQVFSGGYIPILIKNNYPAFIFIGSITENYIDYQKVSTIEYLIDKLENLLRQKTAADTGDGDFNRYVVAADIGRLGIWEMDLVNNRFYASNSLRKLFGSYDFDMGMEMNDLLAKIHPADRDRVYEYFRACIARRELAMNLEFRIFDISEKVHWISAKGRALLDDNMRVSKIIGITQDITENRAEREKLRGDENRLLALVGAIPDKVYKFDEEANLLDYYIPSPVENELNREENIGKNLNEFFPGELGENIRSLIKKVQETGKMEVLEFQDSHDENEYREARIIPAENDSFITVIRNISEKKLLELKSEAAIRETELANKAKTEFIANMSHEFRTPLNGILGYVQILKTEEELSPHIHRGLDVIAKSGNLLLNIINDILDLSKIEANYYVVKENEFGFIDFLEGISALFEIRAREKSLNYYCDISPELPDIVSSDEKILSQILLNLLSNAIKFTKEGEVKLKVFRQSSRIRFEIADTGVGIPETKIEEIFEPFKQLDSNTNKSEGTGLGLTITRKLVNLMDSELKVTSEPGKGSTFYFDLCVKEIYKNLGNNKYKTKKIVGYRGEKKRILVIDDIVENRSFIKTILSRIGFEVFEAADAGEGIQMANNLKPNLIFMDLVMPRMSGLDAIKIIKENQSGEGIKIVAFTANVMQNVKDECFNAGCCDFIAKPVTLNSLTNSLKLHLNLEWIYQADNGNKNNSYSSEELSYPPRDEASLLYEAMINGDLNSIRNELEKLKGKNQFDRFVNLVESLASSFHINKLRDLAKNYLEKVNA